MSSPMVLKKILYLMRSLIIIGIALYLIIGLK